jgi:hypothetical protein
LLSESRVAVAETMDTPGPGIGAGRAAIVTAIVASAKTATAVRVHDGRRNCGRVVTRGSL